MIKYFRIPKNRILIIIKNHYISTNLKLNYIKNIMEPKEILEKIDMSLPEEEKTEEKQHK